MIKGSDEKGGDEKLARKNFDEENNYDTGGGAKLVAVVVSVNASSTHECQ